MVAVVSGSYVQPTVHVPDLPASLAEVICTALATDRSRRFATAAQLIAALEAVAAREGWTLGTTATARLMQQLFDVDASYPVSVAC
jgi:hypothetical protein